MDLPSLGQGSHGLPQALPIVEQHSDWVTSMLISSSHCPSLMDSQHTPFLLSAIIGIKGIQIAIGTGILKRNLLIYYFRDPCNEITPVWIKYNFMHQGKVFQMGQEHFQVDNHIWMIPEYSHISHLHTDLDLLDTRLNLKQHKDHECAFNYKVISPKWTFIIEKYHVTIPW